jgi:hypothetical protein
LTQNIGAIFVKVNTISLLLGRTLKTGLHGFLQNYARPKEVCKKTSETSAGQSSLGGV